MDKLTPKEVDKLAKSVESLSKKEKEDKSLRNDSLSFCSGVSVDVTLLLLLLLLLLSVEVLLLLIVIFKEFDRDRTGVGSGGGEAELFLVFSSVCRT